MLGMNGPNKKNGGSRGRKDQKKNVQKGITEPGGNQTANK
jgi:hypothetical protein